MEGKILIADDETDIVVMLSQFFQGKGYRILTATNGVETLKQVENNPDIILLDINMPGMDGLEVCQRIRDYVSCPILFLTARIEDADKVKGFSVGGDDYIVKPFSLVELEARVKAHLRRETRHSFNTQIKFIDELTMSQLHRLEDARPQGDNSDIKNFVITLADSATIFCEKNGKKICVQNNITDISICLDCSFVSQVNNNLISNAVRYAKSAIKITYTCSKEGFYLTVSDDGCGFSKEALCKATNPYFTGENHREHFGLGLYICKILCEHHGGYLKIENCSTGANATAFFKSLDL